MTPFFSEEDSQGRYFRIQDELEYFSLQRMVTEFNYANSEDIYWLIQKIIQPLSHTSLDQMFSPSLHIAIDKEDVILT